MLGTSGGDGGGACVRPSGLGLGLGTGVRVWVGVRFRAGVRVRARASQRLQRLRQALDLVVADVAAGEVELRAYAVRGERRAELREGWG